jgi:hypothetical protein
LEDLKPFCAFVGPNASGKSNIYSLGSIQSSMVFDIQFEDRLKVSFVGAFLSDPNKFELMSVGGAQVRIESHLLNIG